MSLSIFINNHKLICKTQDRTAVAGPDILDNWLGIEPDYQSRLASVLTCQPRISLHLYPAASVASSPGRRRTPRQKIVTKMLPCSLCYHLDAISCCLISICYTVERFFMHSNNLISTSNVVSIIRQRSKAQKVENYSKMAILGQK